MLLEFNKVSFSYDGRREILKDVSFTMYDGDRIALLGLNGSGKSTLMLLINGLLLPSEGEIKVEGISTRSKKLNELRKNVGLVFQDPDDQLFMPTVREDVSFGPINMKLPDEEVDRRLREALEATHTLDLADMSPFTLSGGQKKSVSIATVLSMNPKLLVMDEPTSGMDYLSSENFVRIMELLPQSFIISTHDLKLARQLCNRVLVLDKGNLTYDGEFNEAPYPYNLTD